MRDTRLRRREKCHGLHQGGGHWLGSRLLLAAVAIVLALVGAVASDQPSPVAAATGAVVEAGPLTLRAEPDAWGVAVGELWHGAWVEILSGPTWNGWYQLRSGELTGWAPGDVLAIESIGVGDAVAVGGAAPGTTAWVVTDAVNVRASPTIDAGIVEVIRQGSALTIIGDTVDGYVPVEQGAGWVRAEFLSFAGPSAPVVAERWVDIDRSEQTVTLYEGDVPVASYWGAMGRDQSESGFFATALGTYNIYEKYQDLSWTVWGRAWVTDWVGFDPERINGFHSYSMDASGQVIPGGAGPTGGCIALAPEAADALFAFVSIGSRVEVHW